jgi:hypothetical protein
VGLFGGDKKIYVASTLYNLAGPEEDRPDYLKSLIAGNVITNSKFSMSETLQSGYLGGPGIKVRSFYRWALTNYADIGVSYASFRTTPVYTEVDKDAILAEIPNPDSADRTILKIEIGMFRYEYYAEKWMFDNHPSYMDTNWSSDFIDSANDLLIFFDTDFIPAGQPSVVTVSIPDADFAAQYAYVTYAKKTTSTLTTEIFVYKMSSGNANLDDLFTPGDDPIMDGFIPYIPARINNEFLSETHMPVTYAAAKRAYKKATGRKLDDLIDSIADNEDLDDIDHAYIVYGVPLNVVENSARKYLYDFFKTLMLDQQYNEAIWQTYTDDFQDYVINRQDYMDYQEDVVSENPPGDPDMGGLPPDLPGAPVKAKNRVGISSSGLAENKLHMLIEWTYIVEETGSGLKKPGAKNGEVWFTTDPVVSVGEVIVPISNSRYTSFVEDDTVIYCHKQIDQNNWSTLKIQGMTHTNTVYGSKVVEITAEDALGDVEESGFLVPLHYGIIREMSLIDSTQMMTAATFIVFNSYEIVKQKWYETGIFKIFVFVLIIAVSVIFAPAGGAAATFYASIGAAIGLTGVAAVVAGAVITALASMIIMKILTVVSTAVFGEKFGQIIAAVAMIVAMAVGPGLIQGQSLSTSWGNLMSAENLLKLGNVLGDGIAGYIKASAMGTMDKTQELIDDYNKESQKISDLYAENIGYGRGLLDPIGLTDFNIGNFMETESQFLSRTLLTGMDIAEMSMDMLTNFSEYTLNTGLTK